MECARHLRPRTRTRAIDAQDGHEAASRVSGGQPQSMRCFPWCECKGKSIAQGTVWTVGECAFHHCPRNLDTRLEPQFFRGPPPFTCPATDSLHCSFSGRGWRGRGSPFPPASPSQFTSVDVTAIRSLLATIAQRAPRGCGSDNQLRCVTQHVDARSGHSQKRLKLDGVGARDV